ncbi:hypothetical protein RhiXN_03010 [Rhizoctonia solani]|uniref:RlpA-like protein double-psi beta-barrel domain-containing protein n=1 Tax=Rhizoctonia solani TaxID=456999 RepID=A0A8H8STN5_9AGAM|nr:uncharacterized protein RhiXN_03010 [Rhizoctonia solani]QRW18086.1 hypothetical protein RhiXN_03010 [Rhizoctonia solani]
MRHQVSRILKGRKVKASLRFLRHVAFLKLAAIAGLASSVLAAPVEAPAATNQLAARAPYDVHNGWASYLLTRAHNAFQTTPPSVLAPAAGTTATTSGGCRRHQPVPGDDGRQACGKTANVSWNGKTIKVGIVDRCYACGYNDIDLSPSAFQQFAGLGTGKLQGVSWKFN